MLRIFVIIILSISGINLTELIDLIKLNYPAFEICLKITLQLIIFAIAILKLLKDKKTKK